MPKASKIKTKRPKSKQSSNLKISRKRNTRSKTPSFVAEFPLHTTSADENTLDKRLDACRNIYNAMLQVMLALLHKMRQDPDWRIASHMPYKTKEEQKVRNAAFQTIKDRYDWNDERFQQLARQHRDACWIGDHIGSHDCQSTVTRAFSAVEAYMFKTKGKPRFKTRSRFRSIEGKSNKAIIIYKQKPNHTIHYGRLTLPMRLKRRDKKKWQAQALERRTKYCRVIKRTIKGRTRWFVQLVQEGLPPQIHSTGTDTVGLDLGPSSIAIVSSTEADLQPLCPTITHPWKKLRRIERAMDRSRRATNPECYDAKGRWIKLPKTKKKQKVATVKTKAIRTSQHTRLEISHGVEAKQDSTPTRASKPKKVPKKVIKAKTAKIHTQKRKIQCSSRYKKLRIQKQETERCLAAERKRSHGELQNQILRQGTTVKTEKVSYRAWQKNYGRSVKVRAPGMFIEGLTRKAESAGGQVLEINTRTTKLSQYDHTTDDCVKKKLSQRWHIFRDGVTHPVQRDIYSAFLAQHCDADTLDVSQVKDSWPATEPLLRQATSRWVQREKAGRTSATCPAPKDRRSRRLSNSIRPPSREPEQRRDATQGETGMASGNLCL
jgi:putative transposase